MNWEMSGLLGSLWICLFLVLGVLSGARRYGWGQQLAVAVSVRVPMEAVQLRLRPEPPSRDGEPFTASTDCPECGVLAVHWIDEPKRATEQQWAEYHAAMADYDPFGNDRVKHVAWSGQVVKTTETNPPPAPPRDEPWSVARVCRGCGHRWGQT
jgi:hypothetical protein